MARLAKIFARKALVELQLKEQGVNIDIEEETPESNKWCIFMGTGPLSHSRRKRGQGTCPHVSVSVFNICA